MLGQPRSRESMANSLLSLDRQNQTLTKKVKALTSELAQANTTIDDLQEQMRDLGDLLAQIEGPA